MTAGCTVRFQFAISDPARHAHACHAAIFGYITGGQQRFSIHTKRPFSRVTFVTLFALYL